MAKKRTVESCEMLDAVNPIVVQTMLGTHGIDPQFGHTRCGSGGERRWLLCPICDRRVGKLYRPYAQSPFACRKCHNLTYSSSRQHDARLDRLLKVPLEDLMEVVKSRKVSRALLGIKATYIRFGLIDKYDKH